MERWFSEAGQKQIFVPQLPLRFEKGKMLIAFTPMTSFYKFCIVTMPLMSLTGLYATYKMTFRFRDRSFLSFILYAVLLGFMGILIFSCNAALRDIVLKVYLKSCGTKISVKRGFMWNKLEDVPIQLIHIPDSLPPTFLASDMALIGYPVTLKGESVVVPKTMEKIRPDLFTAVFNGVEISVDGNSDQEIIIE